MILAIHKDGFSPFVSVGSHCVPARAFCTNIDTALYTGINWNKSRALLERFNGNISFSFRVNRGSQEKLIIEFHHSFDFARIKFAINRHVTLLHKVSIIAACVINQKVDVQGRTLIHET